MSTIQELVVMAVTICLGVSLLAGGVAYLVHRQNNRRHEEYLRWQASKKDEPGPSK